MTRERVYWLHVATKITGIICFLWIRLGRRNFRIPETLQQMGRSRICHFFSKQWTDTRIRDCVEALFAKEKDRDSAPEELVDAGVRYR